MDALKKRKSLTLFLILFFLFGCSAEKEEKTIQKIPIEINTNEKNNRKINIEKIIPLETKKEALFGRPSRITMTDNRIIILDDRGRAALFLFDEKGIFLGKTKKGKGKGECLSPSDYYYDNTTKEIQVFDLGNKKMLYYDLNLGVKSTKKIENNLFFRNFNKLKNGEWLVHYQNQLRGDRNDRKIYSFLKYSADFQTITAPLLPDDIVEHRQLFVINPMSREQDEVLLCRPFDQYLYGFGEENKIAKQYFIDFGDYSITQADIEKGRSHIYSLKKKGERVTVLGDVIHNGAYVACSFVYNQDSQYFIYNKKTKETICSVSLTTLPYGVLKGMKDKNTFILLVKAIDLKTFAADNDIVFEELTTIHDEGNDIIVLFNIPL
jgi:hypothetical protein